MRLLDALQQQLEQPCDEHGGLHLVLGRVEQAQLLLEEGLKRRRVAALHQLQRRALEGDLGEDRETVWATRISEYVEPYLKDKGLVCVCVCASE